MSLSLFADPAMHHVRVQAAYAGARLGAAVKHLCLELLAVLTPPRAASIVSTILFVGTMPAASVAFKMGSPAAYLKSGFGVR